MLVSVAHLITQARVLGVNHHRTFAICQRPVNIIFNILNSILVQIKVTLLFLVLCQLLTLTCSSLFKHYDHLLMLIHYIGH